MNFQVQFGMFIGLFGLLVALIAHFGAVSLFGLSVSPIARFILNTVLSSTLLPLSSGVKHSVRVFMNGGEDFVDKKK